MSNDKKSYQVISEQELLDYLDGKIKGIRANQIERQILNSSFEEEAVEGLSSLSSQDLRSDLSQLKKRLEEQTREKPAYLSFAATIAFLLVAFSSLWFVMNNALPHDEISINRTMGNETENLAMNEPTSIDTVISEAEEDQTSSVTKLAAATEVIPDSSLGIATVANEIEEPIDNEEQIVLAEDIEVTSDTINELITEPDQIVASNELVANSENPIDTSAAFNDSAIAASQAIASRAIAEPVQLESIDVSKKQLAVAAEISPTEPISGTVYYREDGEPLPGVEVTLNNTTAITGLGGDFTIENTENGNTLEFSLSGIRPKTVGIEDSEEITVVMGPDPSNLKEVLIIGYGQGVPSAVNQSPEPESGEKEFKDYIQSNLVYPEEAKNQQIEGAVILKLTVSSDGTINNVEVKKSVSPGCDQEAIRLLREGPPWKPALYNGSPVEGSVRIRVPFYLSK